MTKQILAFLFCFKRELNPYSPLTYSLTSARVEPLAQQSPRLYTPLLPPYPHATATLYSWKKKKRIHVACTKNILSNIGGNINGDIHVWASNTHTHTRTHTHTHTHLSTWFFAATSARYLRMTHVHLIHVYVYYNVCVHLQVHQIMYAFMSEP